MPVTNQNELQKSVGIDMMTHTMADQRQVSQRVPSDRLQLPAGSSLKNGLTVAFEDILSYAITHANNVSDDPVLHVHEYRKAIRRARSLVRILKPIISTYFYQRLTTTLRDIHRATSSLRDSHVVHDTLNNLDIDDHLVPLAESLRGSISTASPVDADKVAATLSEGVALMEPLPAMFVDALPAKVKWRYLSDGLQSTYRSTQKYMRKTARETQSKSIHSWRKRTKELTYQVELLSTDTDSKKLAKLRKNLARLTRTLGEIIDRDVLIQYIHDWMAPEDKQPLISVVEADQARRLRTATRRGKRLLHASSEEFARKLVKAARRAYNSSRHSS